MVDSATSRDLRQSLASAVAAVAILMTIAGVGWSSGRAERDAAALVTRSHDIVDEVGALRARVTAGQGNLSSFLVTLDTALLAAFEANQREARVRLGAISALTSDDPTVARLASSVDVHLGALTEARDQIRRARLVDMDAARLAITSSNVNAIRRAVLADLDSLEAAERALIERRAGIEERAAYVRLAALLAALLAAVGMGAWGLRAVRREIRAVEALSARNLALAADNPDAILVQVEGEIVFANRAAATLFGYADPAALLGVQVFDLIHPDERAAALAGARAAIASRVLPAPWRRRFRHRDGTTIDTELSVALIQFDGRPASQVVIRDLSQRIAAERALAASEQRFRALLDAMQDGVVLQSASLEILLWNPAAERILGLTGEQLASRTSYDPRWRAIDESGVLLSGDAHPAAVAVRTGAPATRVLGIDVPDRERVWLLATSVPLIRQGETVPYAVETTFADITASRQSAARLADSESRYRLLAEHSVDLITRRSPDHTLEYVSPSHETVLGWNPAEMVGRSAMDFLHPEDKAHLAVLREGTGAAHTLARVRHKAGHYLWLEANAAPLRDDAGVITGYQVAARDVTERRALEEQLRHAQKMDALGRMASGVAHDFNNLLTVIQSSSELLRERITADAESVEIIEDIGLAADRAASLTAQLLTFARRQHSVPERIDVMALLRRTYPLLSRLAGSEVAVEMSCADAAIGAVVEAEQAQIEQIAYNLVVNARDAMPAGGTLHIRCDVSLPDAPLAHRHGTLRAGRYVTLTVSDTGSGMADEVLDKLFDPFYTTKPQGKGTGLGLATVLGIVQQAQGSVIVSSAVGAGSTFTVYWPATARVSTRSGESKGPLFTEREAVHPPTQATPRPPASEAAQAEEQRPRVLVVDDEQAVRAIVASVLRRCGFQVEAAGGGEEALAVLRRRGPEFRALVTDVRMPGMGGIELVDAMQQAGVDLPVLFLSGQLDVPIPTHWPATVPRLFLGKPFSMSELALNMQQLVGAERSSAA